jgi:hypothetical protein
MVGWPGGSTAGRGWLDGLWVLQPAADGWMACGFYSRPRMVGWSVGSTAGSGWLPKTGLGGGGLSL